MRIRCSARRAGTLSAVMLAAVLAGCSLVSISYNNAAVLVVWGSNIVFSLTSPQENDLRARFERLLAWHRAERLADYAHLLAQLQGRIQGRLEAADIAWLYAETRKRFEEIVDAAAPDAAALALTLRPDQIDRLERRFARNDREFLESDVNVPVEEARARSIRDNLKSAEKWMGRLDDSQAAQLRELAAQLPLEPRLSHEDYLRRHRDLIELLRASVARGPQSRGELEEGLRRIFGRWQEGQSPEHAQFIARQTAAYHRFFAEAANIATPAQRAHATARLQYYIDEIGALSRRRSASFAPPKHAMGAF